MQLATVDTAHSQLTPGLDDHRAFEDTQVVDHINGRALVGQDFIHLAGGFGQLAAQFLIGLVISHEVLEADLEFTHFGRCVVRIARTERHRLERYTSVAVDLVFSAGGVTQNTPRNVVAIGIGFFTQVTVQHLDSRLHGYAVVVLGVDDPVNGRLGHHQDRVGTRLEHNVVQDRVQQRPNPIGIIEELLDHPQKGAHKVAIERLVLQAVQDFRVRQVARRDGGRDEDLACIVHVRQDLEQVARISDVTDGRVGNVSHHTTIGQPHIPALIGIALRVGTKLGDRCLHFVRDRTSGREHRKPPHVLFGHVYLFIHLETKR
ncbi:hypothetical protein D3C78_531330 [compost metagenome]